ncbi:MAG TPA: S41 family peptidase [Rhizomicrobium sp.]|nr:S41 family peptidase [Rhizomicrobium sp.]
MRPVLLALALLVAGASNAFAQSAYDPKPWLDDLAQMKHAFSTGYANFEWAVFDHEVDLSALFADTQERIESANSDADARAAFDRLIRRLGDGHTELHWPAHKAAAANANTRPLPCAGFDPARAARPLAAYANGYVPIETPQSGAFPIGIITSGHTRVGVIKIKLFHPSFRPAYCTAALAALAIPPDKPCDDACSDKIDDWTQARLNEDFITQVKALEEAKIDTLLVDVADNGGGSEWADAAARMLTTIRLVSPRYGFVRGPHWVKKWTDLANNLRKAIESAAPKDREMLFGYAEEAAAKVYTAAKPCDSSPLWEKKLPACSWLGEGLYQTGFLASADPETLRGKPWAPLVFIPMEYQYTEGLWRGPLIVLVDGGAGSSSERFAYELQSNHAALIMGEPTAGAVGGHTDGGTSTTLTHSGAVLVLPDVCDLPEGGRYATGGVVPDLLVGFHKGDGPHLRAEAFLAKLPEALGKVKYLLKSKS